MITAAKFYRGGLKLTNSGNTNLRADVLVYELDESTVNLSYDCVLASGKRYPPGADHHHIIHNTQVSGVLTIKDNTGGIITTTVGGRLILFNFDNTTDAGDWSYMKL